ATRVAGVVDSPTANLGCTAASTSRTSAPCRARIAASAAPANPDPRMMTSYWCSALPSSDVIDLLHVAVFDCSGCSDAARPTLCRARLRHVRSTVDREVGAGQ